MGKKTQPKQINNKKSFINYLNCYRDFEETVTEQVTLYHSLYRKQTQVSTLQSQLAADSKIKLQWWHFFKGSCNFLLAQVSETEIVVWFCSKPASMGAKFWLTAILQSAGSPVSLKKTKGDLSVRQNTPCETTYTSTDRNRNVGQRRGKNPEWSFGRATKECHIAKEMLKECKAVEKHLKTIQVHWHSNWK